MGKRRPGREQADQHQRATGHCAPPAAGAQGGDRQHAQHERQRRRDEVALGAEQALYGARVGHLGRAGPVGGVGQVDRRGQQVARVSGDDGERQVVLARVVQPGCLQQECAIFLSGRLGRSVPFRDIDGSVGDGFVGGEAVQGDGQARLPGDRNKFKVSGCGLGTRCPSGGSGRGMRFVVEAAMRIGALRHAQEQAEEDDDAAEQLHGICPAAWLARLRACRAPTSARSRAAWAWNASVRARIRSARDVSPPAYDFSNSAR